MQETDRQVPNSKSKCTQSFSKLLGVPGDFPRLVGNPNTQTLATCRLGKSNPKSLLHAGWEIQNPNPCYMQVGKFKPQILATCRLRVQNPQILATRRLGNQTPPPPPPPPSKALIFAGREIKNPKSLLCAGWEITNPQILVTGRLGNQHQINATCRLGDQKPKPLLHATCQLGT